MKTSKPTRRTRDNTAVLLIDHQVGLFTGVRDLSVSDLKHNVVGLARAAKILGLPIIAVTTARDSMWGPTIPELREALGGGEILDRSTVNAWDYAPFVKAVKETGRDHLVIAGLSFEVCASLPAVSAREVGYEPVVAIDACGTFTSHKREAGIALAVLAGTVALYFVFTSDHPLRALIVLLVVAAWFVLTWFSEINILLYSHETVVGPALLWESCC